MSWFPRALRATPQAQAARKELQALKQRRGDGSWTGAAQLTCLLLAQRAVRLGAEEAAAAAEERAFRAWMGEQMLKCRRLNAGQARSGPRPPGPGAGRGTGAA